MDKVKANYLADFSQAMEEVNLLRKPMGAAGFRGKEGLNLLQGMLGSPLDNPAVLKNKWEKLMADYLALRAQHHNTIVRHDGGANVPDRETLDAYVMAAGGDTQKARAAAKKDYGYR
jgi:hypothetical protein